MSVTYPSSCTTPPIAWSTAPAGGTAGGSMTASVTSNELAPTVTWSSSNTGVATVDANGVITYKAAGTTTITASYTGDGSTYCAEEVSVSQEITVEAAPVWKIKGTFDDWKEHILVDNGDNTCSYTYDLSAASDYTFVIFSGDTYYKGGVITSSNHENLSLKTSGNDNTITTVASGNYTFIWNYSTKQLTVTYPSSTYTVTFHANGHGLRPEPQNVESGKTASIPTPPTAEGYTFAGWYTEKECTNAYNFETPVTAELHLYAKWTQNASAVTYYFMGEITGWGNGKGRPMTSEAEYAYIKLSDNQANTNFKIYNANLNNDAAQYLVGCDTTLFDAECGMDKSYKGDIALGPESGGSHHNIRMPASAPSACIVYLYYPNTSINPSSGYVVTAKSIQPQDKSYYFMSDKTKWGEGKGRALTIDGSNVYAYISLTAADVANFKVFEENNNNNSTVYYGGENINNGFNGSNIKLGNDTEWHNATVTDEVTANWYVILYFPNTPINTTNNYYVCASYTLPVVSDPYPVTFGVVDNIGGTLTAKSGNSTIASGSSVNVATFTATPATGYAVEGWYSDEAGTVKIDAAGTGTTYSQTISESNNTVYVKFGKVYAIYFKPNAPINWSNIYAYLFTASPWENDKGVHPTQNRSEYGQMNKLNDSVYYYNLTQTADITHFAFNNDVGQANYGDFYGCEAVYRSDYHKDMPVYISEKGQDAVLKNNNATKYYNKGVWMKFNDTDPGYDLGIRNHSTSEMPYYRFTAEKAGDYISTVTLNLEAGTTYSFLVKNDKAYYFKITNPTTCTSSNHHFELYVHDTGGNEVVITPTVSGAYTFQLNLANGKVEIDVIYPTTEYRLIYVEKSGSTFVKFHPSHTIAVHDAGCDTVSLHVRPNVKDAAGTESANPNTCEVWLQQFVTNAAGTGMEWRTLQQLDVKNTATITGNGVYNFVLEQNGGITMPVEKIHLYTGNYFIRSDASKAGWDFASAQDNLQNRFWYSDYARQHETFDYYCCHWTTNGTNLNFVVANAYSYCITDTLVQNTYEADHNYVDATGNLLNSANIRFMWNSYDNSTDRAYLAGAGDNLFLLSQKGIYDLNGTQQTSLKFADQQNWVYRLDIKSDPNAFIKIKAPYAGYTQYFKGSEAEYSFQLIKGLAGKTYNIRVIYDFRPTT
ncbi:MAG: InlB B-repeat-containing protein [Paludibacteraceae bacterium]|nr:InlB B-repeat-containing protein [Paludibacteraceae bacterium]